MNVNDKSDGKRAKRIQHTGKLHTPRMRKSGANGENLEEKSGDAEKLQITGERRERELNQSGKSLKLRKIDESVMKREGRHGITTRSVQLTKGRTSGDEKLKKMKRRFAVIGRGGIVNVRGRNLIRIVSNLMMKSTGNDARNELNASL